ncbi:MAG: ATP-grasp domain-containing protein [Clostridiaceae bacterium]|nr:ATP-grasp domain-containing protein [Clostridiaceae bacterium]
MSEDTQSPCYRVGIAYNLKHEKEGEPEDEQAEYDSISTIRTIAGAIEKTGCKAVFIEAREDFPEKIKKADVDFVFNIAEGKGGRGREAQVPSILNLYSIPYTGSDETTLCIALDKGIAKKIVKSRGIKTPVFFIWKNNETDIPSRLRFPVIIKPVSEGSSKGILGTMLATNRNELKKLLAEKWARYRQPLMAEEYINGREFTVGIIGNGKEKRVFRPMEIIISPDANPDGSRIYSFHAKTNYERYVKYECPARLEQELEEKIIRVSEQIYDVLECRDFARIDLILDEGGNPYFIEINPLPGLAPGYSDYVMLAENNGVEYDELIRLILNSALKRCGMKTV